MKLRLFAIVFTALGVGCTNLAEVRQFSGESAKLAAYTELTEHFRDTYAREQPYLYGDEDKLAKTNDLRRKAAYGDLVKIHDNISRYMATLARLAGEDTFDLSHGVLGIADGIEAYPELGIDEAHVDAYSKVVTIVSKWLTSAYQESAVKSMVKEGAKPIATTLEGMSNILRYYQKTHENEKRQVTGFLDGLVRIEQQANNRLLASLGRAHLQEKQASYSATDARIKSAQDGVKAVSEGHAALVKNIDRLSKQESKARLKSFANDIKAIRKSLQDLKP